MSEVLVVLMNRSFYHGLTLHDKKRVSSTFYLGYLGQYLGQILSKAFTSSAWLNKEDN